MDKLICEFEIQYFIIIKVFVFKGAHIPYLAWDCCFSVVSERGLRDIALFLCVVKVVGYRGGYC